MRPPRPLPAYVGRRLAASAAGVLLALGAPLGLGLSPASATGTAPNDSPTPSQSPGQSEDEPTDVFVGVVDRVSTGQGDGGAAGAITYDVTVLSVYLGDIRTESVEVGAGAAIAPCTSRRVVPDTQYAFTVQSAGDSLRAGACNDIRPATTSVRDELARDYPGVRPPVAPEATFDEVAYTSSETTEPIAFTRAAAPGLALVLVGLLGLVVTRRFAAR